MRLWIRNKETAIFDSNMEISMSSIAGAIAVVISVAWALKMVNWVWVRPKKLEKCLRKQGLKGNSYKLLYGDLNEISLAMNEVRSRTISLSDDIVPHVIPHISQNIEQYGKDSFMWFGPTPRVNIMDPKQIREVFNKYTNFQKPSSAPLRKMFENGMLNLEGEKWARRRKIINPAFHVEKLKLMLPAFDLSCIEMIDKWEDSISTDRWCELDVWPYLENLTGDVISRTAFGTSYEEGRVIFQLQKEQVELVIKASLSPYPGSRFLPTKMNKRIKEIDNTVKSVLKSIISKREEAMKAGEAAKNDLLGIMLHSNMKEIEDHGNKKNVGMSLADIIEECKLFYLAGQETTSVLLVWTMVLLSQHPDWQERARDEVFQVFGDKKPNYEELSHLKIVTMILNEVLRLYSPIFMLTRTVHKETKLGDLTLPEGVMIQLPTIMVHHDPELWGDDAKEFKPERFAEGVSKATKNQLSFFPFGGGPRICIGQNFALIEAKLALAMILQHFWFELSASYVHAPAAVVTMQPQRGCHIVLHKR